MKKIIFNFIAVLALPLYGMEDNNNNNASVVTKYSDTFVHAPVEKYPASISYLPVKEVLGTKDITAIPDDIKQEVKIFVQSNPCIIEWCKMPANTQEYYSTQKAMATVSSMYMGNMSKNNVTVWSSSTKKAVIKIASLSARIRNNLVSIGQDPAHIDQMEDAKRKQLFQNAFQFKRTMQHTTIPVGQYLFKKFNAEVVQYLPTWLFHLENRPVELEDGNYFTVQAAIPADFKKFADLSKKEQEDFLADLDLDGFYSDLRGGHYAFPSADNLWVNLKTAQIILPDTESPDNEGLGINRKWGKAVLGQDLWKAKHNIEYGHNQFKNILKEHSARNDEGKQELVDRWVKLYNEDTLVHK